LCFVSSMAIYHVWIKMTNNVVKMFDISTIELVKLMSGWYNTNIPFNEAILNRMLLLVDLSQSSSSVSLRSSVSGNNRSSPDTFLTSNAVIYYMYVNLKQHRTIYFIILSKMKFFSSIYFMNQEMAIYIWIKYHNKLLIILIYRNTYLFKGGERQYNKTYVV
jgi:hypothetical protein